MFELIQIGSTIRSYLSWLSDTGSDLLPKN